MGKMDPLLGMAKSPQNGERPSARFGGAKKFVINFGGERIKKEIVWLELGRNFCPGDFFGHPPSKEVALFAHFWYHKMMQF